MKKPKSSKLKRVEVLKNGKWVKMKNGIDVFIHPSGFNFIPKPTYKIFEEMKITYHKVPKELSDEEGLSA